MNPSTKQKHRDRRRVRILVRDNPGMTVRELEATTLARCMGMDYNVLMATIKTITGEDVVAGEERICEVTGKDAVTWWESRQQ